MTVETWSERDERQYQRIIRAELDLGKSEELAEEIAWRTVQLQRMAEGCDRAETAGDSRLGAASP